jgi:hypothetical protein
MRWLLNNLLSDPQVTDSLGLAQISIANVGYYLTTRVSYKLNLRIKRFDAEPFILSGDGCQKDTKK